MGSNAEAPKTRRGSLCLDEDGDNGVDRAVAGDK